MRPDYSNYITFDEELKPTVKLEAIPEAYIKASSEDEKNAKIARLFTCAGSREFLKKMLSRYFDNIEEDLGYKNSEKLGIKDLLDSGFFQKTSIFLGDMQRSASNTEKESRLELKSLHVIQTQKRKAASLISSAINNPVEYASKIENLEKTIEIAKGRYNYATAAKDFNNTFFTIARTIFNNDYFLQKDLETAITNSSTMNESLLVTKLNGLIGGTHINLDKGYTHYTFLQSSYYYHFNSLKNGNDKLTPEGYIDYMKTMKGGKKFISNAAELNEIPDALFLIHEIEPGIKEIQKKLEQERVKQEEERERAEKKAARQQEATDKSEQLKEKYVSPIKKEVRVKRDENGAYERGVANIDQTNIRPFRHTEVSSEWTEVNKLIKTKPKAILGEHARHELLTSTIVDYTNHFDKDCSWQTSLCNRLMSNENIESLQKLLIAKTPVVTSKGNIENEIVEIGGTPGIFQQSFSAAVKATADKKTSQGLSDFNLLKQIYKNRDIIANAIEHKSIKELTNSTNPEIKEMRDALRANKDYITKFQSLTMQKLKQNVELFEYLRENPLIIALSYGNDAQKSGIVSSVLNRTLANKDVSFKIIRDEAKKIFELTGCQHGQSA